jgi:hypothetical protein
MLIAVVNQSTLVQNSDVATMCAAINTQIVLNVAPAWEKLPCPVKFYANDADVPNWAWTIYVVDNDTAVSGALGFHEEQTDGKIDGYIMVEPILDNGGAIMVYDISNPSQYTVSATLSHECLETYLDRYTNCWFESDADLCVIGEICDPVESISYPISVNGVQVAVSDFVFPSFFNPDATLSSNGPFNYLKSLVAPFTMLSGGYWIQMVSGAENQVFGENMPNWRRLQKNNQFSRRNRRTDPNLLLGGS